MHRNIPTSNINKFPYSTEYSHMCSMYIFSLREFIVMRQSTCETLKWIKIEMYLIFTMGLLAKHLRVSQSKEERVQRVF